MPLVRLGTRPTTAQVLSVEEEGGTTWPGTENYVESYRRQLRFLLDKIDEGRLRLDY